MMDRSDCWLPPARQDEIESAIRRAFADWLGAWLAKVPDLACRVDDGSVAVSPIAQGIDATRSDLVALGLAACDGRADAENSLDSRILMAVGIAIVEQARVWLAELGPSESGDMMRCEISPRDGTWTVTLALGNGQVNRLRRQAAGVRRTVKLSPIGEAMGSETAVIGCLIGRTQISTAEVAGLAQGDLIVLGSRPADTLAVTVAGNVCAEGSVRIGQREGAINMSIVEPVGLAAFVDADGY